MGPSSWHPSPGRAAVGCAMRWDLATSSEAGWSYSHPTREATTPRLHLSLWISLFPSGSARKKQPGGSHPGGGGGQSQVSERHVPKEWPRWQLGSPTQSKTKGGRDVGGTCQQHVSFRGFSSSPAGGMGYPPLLHGPTSQSHRSQCHASGPVAILPLLASLQLEGGGAAQRARRFGAGGHLSPLFLRVTPAPSTHQQASGQGIGRTAPFGARVGTRGWFARVGRDMHPRMR